MVIFYCYVGLPEGKRFGVHLHLPVPYSPNGPGWHGGSRTSPQGSFFIDGGADAADNKRALERLFRVVYRLYR